MLDMMGNRNLRDLLDERASRSPNKTFLVTEDRFGVIGEQTYSEFRRNVDALAAGLEVWGVEPGERVCVHLPNCAEILETWFALATLGAVFVPSNTANTVSELRHVVSHSGSVLIISEPSFANVVTEATEEDVPMLRGVAYGRLGPGESPMPGALSLGSLKLKGAQPSSPGPKSDDVLQIVYTSGTTASPKGVVLTHANALFAGEQGLRTFLLDTSDRTLTCLPIFHVNAQAFTLLAGLAAGATCIVLESYSASKFMNQIRFHEATHLTLVSTHARTLLAQPPQPDDAKHEVRRVFYALYMSTEERDAFEDRFGMELINGYGLSEAMVLVTASPVFGPKRWPSIGLPVHDREVRLVDAHGVDVVEGEVGEIIVKGRPGRTIMLGYHKDPEATSQAMQDGWLYTGDNAFADANGYLHFFDRRKDMIKRAGENISSAEVEAALLKHPDIAEASVVGVADAIRGEAVSAFVVLHPSTKIAIEEIQAHCQKFLSYFKIPTSFSTLESLPKTSIGKIKKNYLKQIAESEMQDF